MKIYVLVEEWDFGDGRFGSDVSVYTSLTFANNVKNKIIKREVENWKGIPHRVVTDSIELGSWTLSCDIAKTRYSITLFERKL